MPHDTATTSLRILDANINRAAEGIRVIEDILRFHHNDAPLAARMRTLRHSIRAIAASLPGLTGARDSARDIARNAPPASPRTSLSDIISANFKRAQEALRVIEENLKTVAPHLAPTAGELRFSLYDLEKIISSKNLSPLPAGKFIYPLLSFDQLSPNDFALLHTLAAARVSIIQLRDKNLSDAASLHNATIAATRCHQLSVSLIVNDRPDIASAACASGVHLGQDDLPISAARTIAPSLITGISTHSLEQAAAALASHPDYIAVGPIFPSPTKSSLQPVGLDLIRHIASLSHTTPIVAIGGITTANISSVFQAGAAGAALISTLTTPRATLAETLTALNTTIDSFN